MPPKRAAGDATDTAATSKKFRSAIDETISEFICPITQELPLDPVTAEDGRVYEREAIEAWLARAVAAKSPVTNEPMGTRLFPAVQARNAIERMIRSGAISGDKAEKWEARLQAEEEMKDLRRKAEGGDALAMNDLGVCYLYGTGVPKDLKQARSWYERAAQAGNVRGLTNLGFRCLDDDEPGSYAGLVHLAEAATRGDAYACVLLGAAYADGDYGLAEDAALAKRWYSKALDCTDEEGEGPDDDDANEAEAWLADNEGVQAVWKC